MLLNVSRLLLLLWLSQASAEPINLNQANRYFLKHPSGGWHQFSLFIDAFHQGYARVYGQSLPKESGNYRTGFGFTGSAVLLPNSTVSAADASHAAQMRITLYGTNPSRLT